METCEVGPDSPLPELRSKLSGMVNKVPPNFQAWGVMKVREFKRDIIQARDRLATGKAHLIWDSIKRVGGYW